MPASDGWRTVESNRPEGWTEDMGWDGTLYIQYTFKTDDEYLIFRNLKAIYCNKEERELIYRCRTAMKLMRKALSIESMTRVKKTNANNELIQEQNRNSQI